MSESEIYKLRKVVQCHEQDVRCVASLPNGFVTGSRDKRVKFFYDQNAKFTEVQNCEGPTHFVASVATYIKENGEAIVYVGSNDANIYCYSVESNQPLRVLQGHSGTVCSLSINGNVLASGSWDVTCRVWKDEKPVKVLIGHEGAVWALCHIASYILTGSADKLIKLWNWNESDEPINVFEGHTECVRGLVSLSDTQFLSCSNDASIRHWNLNGEVLGVYYGHNNYIYAISLKRKDTDDFEYVTCSEDRSLKVWKRDTCVQTIPLPAPTLWSVSFLSNGDIVTGASNGKVYIYTCDDKLKASEADQQSIKNELADTTLTMNDLGDIKVSSLPGSEALLIPGKSDGQTKIIQENGQVSAHQWSSHDMQWVKVGEVVGAADTTHDPSQKTVFEGKEYDYVFSVDIEDGAPPLKLPYNLGENPYMAAQEFIHRNDLSQLYLDQIANFIIKNSEGKNQ